MMMKIIMHHGIIHGIMIFIIIASRLLLMSVVLSWPSPRADALAMAIGAAGPVGVMVPYAAFIALGCPPVGSLVSARHWLLLTSLLATGPVPGRHRAMTCAWLLMLVLLAVIMASAPVCYAGGWYAR